MSLQRELNMKVMRQERQIRELRDMLIGERVRNSQLKRLNLVQEVNKKIAESELFRVRRTFQQSLHERFDTTERYPISPELDGDDTFVQISFIRDGYVYPRRWTAVGKRWEFQVGDLVKLHRKDWGGYDRLDTRQAIIVGFGRANDGWYGPYSRVELGVIRNRVNIDRDGYYYEEAYC